MHRLSGFSNSYLKVLGLMKNALSTASSFSLESVFRLAGLPPHDRSEGTTAATLALEILIQRFSENCGVRDVPLVCQLLQESHLILVEIKSVGLYFHMRVSPPCYRAIRSYGSIIRL